jgi:predicted cupin superfamily sugar epimerase
MPTASDLIAFLALRPHPEGGHFAETFRSPLTVEAHGAERAASTAIYFLLDVGEVSRWHRVRSDEVWHWYDGGELELLLCAGVGRPIERRRLAPPSATALPQSVVPAGWWQAARPLAGHVLVGCTVAPGFDFADFALVERAGAVADWFRAQADPRLVDG